jgi:hypothetical protein
MRLGEPKAGLKEEVCGGDGRSLLMSVALIAFKAISEKVGMLIQ